MIKTFLHSTAVACLLAVGAASAWADGSVMFNYQGRVKVQGSPYNGTGQFKFAILNTSASASLWSNDGTSSAGSEPTASLLLTVTDGIFDVVMGDTTLMGDIDPTIFQSRTPLRLRVWFNDGTHGFQALNPDHKLINVSLISSETGSGTCTLFVNGTTGNDANNGLTTATAKKTIQATLSVLPAKINCDFTIDIADGLYAEFVTLGGISINPANKLKFIGDETWSPAAGGNPAVVISGADGATSGVREFAARFTLCSGVEFYGLTFTSASRTGISLENGRYSVTNCVSWGNGSIGIVVGPLSDAQLSSVVSRNNVQHGIVVSRSASADITSGTATFNGSHGLFVNGNSLVGLHTKGKYDDNGFVGVSSIYASAVTAFGAYSGTASNNGEYGIQAAWNSFFASFLPTNTITGNPSGPALTFAGGNTNY
jgi:hypothetical protein